MIFDLNLPREGSSAAPSHLRDVLNETLKHVDTLPFSSWKDSWKEKYPDPDSDGNFEIIVVYCYDTLLPSKRKPKVNVLQCRPCCL